MPKWTEFCLIEKDAPVPPAVRNPDEPLADENKAFWDWYKRYAKDYNFKGHWGWEKVILFAKRRKKLICNNRYYYRDTAVIGNDLVKRDVITFQVIENGFAVRIDTETSYDKGQHSSPELESLHRQHKVHLSNDNY
jgi:hypothetical protein